MSASSEVKDAGLKSLTQVIDLTGVPRSTLEDWADNRPRLFKIIIGGCLQVVAALEGESHE
jgi:hypothetical protein